MSVAVTSVGPFTAALALTRPAQRISFSAHQRVDERRQQLAQYIGMGVSESVSHQLAQVDIVNIGHRV
jgi:hypothetical protein